MIRLASLLLLSSALFSAPVCAQTTYGISSDDVGLAGPTPDAADREPIRDLDILTPDEIAADMRTIRNPRTGEVELVGPTFDPLSEDEAVAGQINLRHPGDATVYSLDGDLLKDGVLLDISLFYSSQPDALYGRTRDGVFLNGEPVPMVLADRQELECSSRVTETIYTSEHFYHPAPPARYGGLYRPAPVYHYFGLDLFDFQPRASNRRRGYDRRYRRNYRPERYRDGRYGRWDDGSYWRRLDRRDRRRRDDRTGRDRDRDRDRDDRRSIRTSDDSGQGRPRRERGYIRIQPEGTGSLKDQRRSDRRRPSTDRPARERRRGRQTAVSRPERRTSAPTIGRPPTNSAGPTPNPVTPVRPVQRDRADRNVKHPVGQAPKPVRRKGPTISREDVTQSGSVRPRRNFFPRDQYGYGSSVVSASRDCAYEDRVEMFIPLERLEAARFDGLSLVMRDVSLRPDADQVTIYDEQFLYVPPHYVEGFLNRLSDHERN